MKRQSTLTPALTRAEGGRETGEIPLPSQLHTHIHWSGKENRGPGRCKGEGETK